MYHFISIITYNVEYNFNHYVLYLRVMIIIISCIILVKKIINNILYSQVLIFSQFTTMLDILQGYVQQHLGVGCARIDGNTSRL